MPHSEAFLSSKLCTQSWLPSKEATPSHCHADTLINWSYWRWLCGINLHQLTYFRTHRVSQLISRRHTWISWRAHGGLTKTSCGSLNHQEFGRNLAEVWKEPQICYITHLLHTCNYQSTTLTSACLNCWNAFEETYAILFPCPEGIVHFASMNRELEWWWVQWFLTRQ